MLYVMQTGCHPVSRNLQFLVCVVFERPRLGLYGSAETEEYIFRDRMSHFQSVFCTVTGWDIYRKLGKEKCLFSITSAKGNRAGIREHFFATLYSFFL